MGNYFTNNINTDELRCVALLYVQFIGHQIKLFKVNIYYFLISLGSASAVIIWLGKFIITKTVDVGIEKYKAGLIKDIEKHKADLSKITLEHQIKFSKLHEERGEKIKTLYNKIIELQKTLIYSTTFVQGPDFGGDTNRDDESLRKINTLVELIDFEKIYFSNSTILKFETLINESKEILSIIRKARMYYSEYNRLVKSGQHVPDEFAKEMKLWGEANTRTEKEFAVLKEELANEFRFLLGINS